MNIKENHFTRQSASKIDESNPFNELVHDAQWHGKKTMKIKSSTIIRESDPVHGRVSANNINNAPSPKHKSNKSPRDGSPAKKRESKAKEFAKGLVGVVNKNNMMDYGLKNDMKNMQEQLKKN